VQKPSEPYMAKIVGVRFRSGGKVYNFDPGDLDLKIDDLVIVETENGLLCGKIAGSLQQVSLDYLKKPLKKVHRKVTEEDLAVLKENRMMEQEARGFCYSRIEARQMQMKLVEAEYLFDRSKVIFYFTADGRVDFRELVKDLAARLRSRIEMRQIGVRDEAKMIGGYGACGKEFCCKTFVREFEPVSIKMAKKQDLTLNPSKISGVCGRLMCCLSYENSNYSCFKKGLPKPGKSIQSPNGPVKVISHNVLKDSITVLVEGGKRIDIIEPELSRLRKGLPLEKPLEGVEEPISYRSVKSETEPMKKMRPPRQKERQPEAASRQMKAVEPKKEKEGLLSRIKKIAGVEKEADGTEKKKPRRRRRRRGRSRGKGQKQASGDSDEKKKE
jgi:cell fate regulator YaaT (PSP1 superfamily)